MLLKERTAVVYGGSGAVGGAVAQAFAREGARVLLAGRSRERREEVAGEIAAAGGQVEVAPVDALDPRAVSAHFEAIAEKAGPVRIMFNAIDWGDTQGAVLTQMEIARFLRPVDNAL